MDIAQKPAPVVGANVKSEYAVNPIAQEGPPPKKEENFGALLNRMSGVSEGKNLYKADQKNEMSKDSYLKMMMEQIKYQDPFNPVKNEQFTQNMAMMGQLEQQINMNTKLEKMLGQNNNMQIAALQLVGKTVQANSASIFHEAGKFSNVSFQLPQDAKELSVDVLGPSGEVLKSINLGMQSQGNISTKWDGLLENDQPVPSGKYSYAIRATDMDGKEISIPSRLEGRVTGITNSQGVTFLLVGDRRVALNEVETIKEEGAVSAPSAGVADFVNASKGAAAAAPVATQKTDEGDQKPAGTKVATKIDVDALAEKALQQSEDSKTGEAEERQNPLEKEQLNDLMQVMFR